jgi:HEPN domain-containing protein
MMPTTSQEWSEVATERQSDARALCEQRAESVGTVYLAGYAVECALKAYLQRAGLPFPTAGREGHNLRGLWRSSGFRLRDLADHAGTKSFYINCWSTDLRYETSIPSIAAAEHLVAGAGQLTGWILSQAKRQRRRR